LTIAHGNAGFGAHLFPQRRSELRGIVGSKVTVDEQIAGCTAVIAAGGARTKDRAVYLIRGADYLTRTR